MERWRPSLAGNVLLLFSRHSKKLTTRRCDAPIKAFQYSDLQERGSEMTGTSKSAMSKFTGALVLSLAILVWSGCGGGMNVGGSSSTSNGVVITPAGMTLRAGDSTQFSAKVTGNANQSVTWSVNGIPTGNATVGMIDGTGKYIAPSSVPTPNSVKISAI